MSITYEKSTDKNLKETMDALQSNLKNNGFGVLWHLNFKDKLEEKGLELKDDYFVFEVCNPKEAKQLLDFNIHIGTILPCKVIVRRDNDKTYIGMISPEVLIGLFKNPELDDLAKKLDASLKDSIDASL